MGHRLRNNGSPSLVELRVVMVMETGQGRRSKGIGVRVWLVVKECGSSELEEIGKQSIMKRTGLPARDLRVLDPLLSYPSSILGRERAIVINLEHIKAIITATQIFMINSTNPLVLNFLQDLRHRISNHKQAVESNDPGMEFAVEGAWESETSHYQHDSVKCSANESLIDFSDESDTGRMDDSYNTKLDASIASCPKSLPFEFKALEACLESACRCLESETRTLEDEAYPALDELTSKISTLNLDRVRQIKSRLVQLSGRVQKVRDELEHLLDDANDMAEMYLTEKISSQPSDQTSSEDDAGDAATEEDDERVEESKSDNYSELLAGTKFNIEELEMLLEAYFAQIDGVLQKVSDMSEYVNDTEDFINIMLDEKQNQLLQMGVMLSTANMILNAGIVVVGLFGMNIAIPLFDGQPAQFWETTFGTIGGCVVLYLFAVGWGKKRKLLAL